MGNKSDERQPPCPAHLRMPHNPWLGWQGIALPSMLVLKW